jgi:hypothetical protein
LLCPNAGRLEKKRRFGKNFKFLLDPRIEPAYMRFIDGGPHGAAHQTKIFGATEAAEEIFR